MNQHKQRQATHSVVSPSRWWSSTKNYMQSGTLEFQSIDREEEILYSRIEKKGFNSCEHYKGEKVGLATYISSHDAGDYSFWEHTDVGSHLYHLSGNLALRKAKDLCRGALRPAREQVAFYLERSLKRPPQDISILNFIYELKEFETLFTNWKPKLTYLAQISNARLAWQYGWKLFIQDVITMLRALFTLQKRIKKYLSEAGKVKQARYRIRHPLLRNGLEGWDEGVVDSNHNYGGVVDANFASFHASYNMYWKASKSYEVANCRYSYWIPKMSHLQAQIRMFLNAFGVEWNAQIIWDMIPLSFVVDWFIHVGDFLRDWIRIPAMPVYVRIHDMSVTRTSIIDATVRFRWEKYVTPTPSQPVFDHCTIQCKGKAYVRGTNVHTLPTPNDLIVAGFSGVGKTRLLNGLALLTSRTEKPSVSLPFIKNLTVIKKLDRVRRKAERRKFRKENSLQSSIDRWNHEVIAQNKLDKARDRTKRANKEHVYVRPPAVKWLESAMEAIKKDLVSVDMAQAVYLKRSYH